MTNPTLLTRRSAMLMPLAFPIALSACKPGADILQISGLTMGTTFNITAVNGAGNVTEEKLRKAVDVALAEVNTQMSNWDEASEISRFNAQTGTDIVAMSDGLSHVMRAAEEVNIASQGRFDTTAGPLIELWGFGAPGKSAMPSEAAILDAQARSGHGNTLQLERTGLRKIQSDAQVYLAAIGKGYGADRVGQAIESLGIADYMVEIGGDLYAAGTNPDGKPWQIGIETPDARDRGVLDVIGVSGLGLASSGDYRNYFEQDGKRFSHVIDPTTGQPITHTTASATVLEDDAMLADAWATAMMTLGREKGMEIAEANNIAVLFIERDASSAQMKFDVVKSSRFDTLTS